MDEVIKRAIVSINENIEKFDKTKASYNRKTLIALRNDFQKQLNAISTTNDLVGLFFRRLARLIDYNKSLTNDEWLNVYKEFLYILKEHDVSTEQLNWMKFSAILKLEGELQQREIHFKKIFGELKTLQELIQLHRNFLNEYLRTCTSLHSKVQVRGLVENVDDLLRNIYQQKDMKLSFQTKERLHTALKCIDIPLECSYKLLGGCSPRSVSDFPSHKEIDDSPNVFRPWMKDIRINSDSGIVDIHERLADSRWLVILGDPGSAKTTLMRLIMRLFSEAALQGHERVFINGIDWGPLRIPILIRIGEFAQWLDAHSTLTLFDYIGQHTWFSHLYSTDDTGCVLKEFIHHGHALIILDGLDEIPVFERRREIVDHVREFIKDHVHGRDFLSAFDKVPESFNQQYRHMYRFHEAEPPSIPGGNQVIVTSRIVGYSSNPLNSPLIEHYFIPPMTNQAADKFVEHWFQRVDQEVHRILLSEGLELDCEIVKNSMLRRQNTLNEVLRDHRTPLLLRPLMLSMLCSCMLKLSDDFPSSWSRVQLYHITVQSTMRNWISQQASMSEKVLLQFETDLALYLHSYSPSGLIDEFDMKRLCYLVLKEQRLSNDRAKLRQYTDELIALIDCNDSIIVERGLQVFSFVHLSFQEYFVGLSLLRESSIDDIVKRFLAFAINSRFREPLRLAFSWISWKWPLNDYETFCRKLITQSVDYPIPLGALLFLDTIDDVQCLPSGNIIRMALDSLLDHTSDVVSIEYFGRNCFRLPKKTIVKWMHLSLVNEKRILKFCKSFLNSISRPGGTLSWKKHNYMLTAICRKLWSLHSIGFLVESIVSQTLRHIVTLIDLPQPIFNDELSQYLVSHRISEVDIHPLVLTVIIALCGGIHKTKDQVYFSPRHIHRSPLIVIPIIEYFENINDPHPTKVQKLIEKYEYMLRMCSPTDISSDIIDTFIALICLRGVSQPSIYSEFDEYRALPLALKRFKWILFFLRNVYGRKSIWENVEDFTFPKIKLIMGVFLSQSGCFDEQYKWFSLACAIACNRLRIEWQSDLSNFDAFYNSNFDGCSASHLELCRLLKFFYITSSNQRIESDGAKSNQSIKDIHLYQRLKDDPIFLLTFVPDSLQHLYHRLIMTPTSQCDSLPLVVLLSQCFIFFDDYTESYDAFITLFDLLPLFKNHSLENYVLALFWEDESLYMRNDERPNAHIFAQFSTVLSKSCEILITEERQRITEAERLNQTQQKDIQLFVASLSLARLLQAQCRIRKNKADISHVDMGLLRYERAEVQHRIRKHDAKMSHIDISLLDNESEQVLVAVENITDPILHIIAMSTILDMKHPAIFDENQSHVLRCRVIYLLESFLPAPPLLIFTLLFIRCQTLRQTFPSDFQKFAHTIGQQLVSVSTDEETVQNQETAYVALNMMSDSTLSPFLTEFEKRTKNLPDLLQMNSVILHRYFVDTTSLGELDCVLLSSMYLSELAIDAQILKKNANINQQNEILSLEKVRQLLSQSKNIITFESATLISCCLESCSKETLAQITDEVLRCSTVQKNAQPVILEWLNCQINESIRSLVYYAALLLAKVGVITSKSIDVINELCLTSIDEKFIGIIRNFFELQSIDLALLRDTLVILIRGARRSSLRTGAMVRCCEIMKLVLQLEREHLSSSAHCLRSTDSLEYESCLRMIDGCVLEVQIYLEKHLLTVISVDSEFQNPIKEQYLAIIVSWIIQHFAFERCTISDILYERVILFLHDQRFPRVQKAVVNALKNVFLKMSKRNIFTNKDIKTHLETVIGSCMKTGDADSENLLAAGLHAYGYCLIFTKKNYPNQNLSNEMHSLLTMLFEKSSSSLISARAGQCLLSIERFIHGGSVINWLSKNNLTPEKIYNVFIQSTVNDNFCLGSVDRQNALMSVFLANPTKLVPRFVKELYNNLHEKASVNDLSEGAFIYVQTARTLCVRNLSLFRATLEQCSFNEQDFKTALCQASKRGDHTFRNECIDLYTCFGEVTPELIDMILYSKDPSKFAGTYIVDNLTDNKRVLLDRDTIEKLYEALESPISHILAANLIMQFVQTNSVSMLELYQQISATIDKHASEDLYNYRNNYEYLFRILLSLSCIASMDSSTSSLNQQLTNKLCKFEIFTEEQIDKAFEIATQQM